MEGSYINRRSGERERGGDVSERPHSGGNLLVQLSQFCLPLLQLLPQPPRPLLRLQSEKLFMREDEGEREDEEGERVVACPSCVWKKKNNHGSFLRSNGHGCAGDFWQPE